MKLDKIPGLTPADLLSRKFFLLSSQTKQAVLMYTPLQANLHLPNIFGAFLQILKNELITLELKFIESLEKLDNTAGSAKHRFDLAEEFLFALEAEIYYSVSEMIHDEHFVAQWQSNLVDRIKFVNWYKL